MRSILEGRPPVGAILRSCPVETLRQYNFAQRREDKKKVLARPVIVQSYFGDDAPVTRIPAKLLIGGFHLLEYHLDAIYVIILGEHSRSWGNRDSDRVFPIPDRLKPTGIGRRLISY